jgi:ligand-binding sensor domain-containing protein
MLRLLWILLLMLIIPFLGNAQNRQGPFLSYQNIQALTGKRIIEVCEGNNQTIWIATSDGLVRFDGHRYTNFFSGPESITDNQVSAVLEDDSSRIWIGGNLHGISRYDINSGRFRRWPVIFDSRIQNERVRSISKTSDGNIWIATDVGLGCYIPSIDSFTLFQPHAQPRKFISLTPHPMHVNLMWVLSNDSIFLFDMLKKNFTPYLPKNVPITNGRTAFTCMDTDGKDGLWIGTWSQGLFHYEGKTKTLTPINIPKEEVSSNTLPVVLDVKQINDTLVLFACSGSGLLAYNPIHKSIKSILKTSVENAHELDVISISHGKNTGLWIGSIGKIFQWHPYFSRLGNYQSFIFRPNEKNLLVSELVYDSLAKKHILACAGMAGIVVTDENFENPYPIRGKNVTDSPFADIAKLPDGPWLALAYYSGRTYSVSLTDKKMQPFKLSIEDGEVIELLENDVYGRLWAASNRTVYCFRQKDSTTLKFKLANNTRPIEQLQIYTLKTDQRGRAWLSSNQGLYRADAHDNSLKHISPLNSEGKQMNAELIKSLAVDQKDGIWLGYDGAGLQRMDADDFSITDSWLASQLPSSSINHLCFTNSRQLLAATPAGMAALIKIKDEWELYSKKDGLIDDFLDQPILASPTGLILVNLSDKIQYFNESILKHAKQNLQIKLTECLVNNESLQLSTMSNHLLNLSYQQNNIDIEFAAMHWLFPGETKYFYRIYQPQKDTLWKPLSEPRLLLASLKPGQYPLQLFARGAGGSKSDIYALDIHISKPWWWQWWFILSAISVALFCIYILHRYRIRQLLKIQQIRNRISKDLHDDIGSTLTSIHILSNVSEKAIELNPLQAKEMLQTISIQSKQVQQNMSDIVWAIRPDNDKIEDLVSRMREYIGQSFEPQQINAHLNVDTSILNLSLPMEYRKEILLVYKEAMNNVLKHSGATSVEINLVQLENMFQLEIIDNGKWKVNIHSSGMGSHSMRDRAKQIGGTLKIAELSTGTKVTLTAPIP